MKKKVGLILLSILLLIVMGGVGVGLAMYWGWQAMQQVAQDVYGGKPPSSVMAIVGIAVSDQKMTVMMDMETQLVYILCQQNTQNTSANFADKDVKQAIESFKYSEEYGLTDTVVSEGETDTMDIGGRTVPTLHVSLDGESQEAGILNLEGKKLLFIAQTQGQESDHDLVGRFLAGMPSVYEDTHYKQAQ